MNRDSGYTAGRELSRDHWRTSFADAWTELATIRDDACEHGRLTGGQSTWARAVLSGASLRLRVFAALGPQGDDRSLDPRDDYLWWAASALEACACVWGELGSVAGSRRTHLVRQLESRLREDDRRALHGIVDWRVSRRAVDAAAGHALGALDRLDRGGGDRAKLLNQLEEGAVALAVLGVRAALDLGSDDRLEERDRPSPPLVEELIDLAQQAAAARNAEDGGKDVDTVGWLCRAIEKQAPQRAVDLLGRSDIDRCLRAEAILAVRSYWFALGGLEAGAIEAIDRDLGRGPLACSEPILRLAAQRAAALICGGGLDSRSRDLDHALAVDYQRSGLLRAVRSCARGLGGEVGELARARRFVLARLARALMVVWALDRQLGLVGMSASETKEDGQAP